MIKNNRPHFIDGKLKIPSKATVHDCMDFFHGVKEDCKETQHSVRWNKKNCLVRVNSEKKKNEAQIRLSATQIMNLRTDFFATVDNYGMGQYGYGTATASNKIDACITYDQALSNYWYALHHCISYDSAFLKKTVWTSSIIEEYLADQEKKEEEEEAKEKKDEKKKAEAQMLSVRSNLRYKGFTFVAPGAQFPLHAPLQQVRLAAWVYADKSIELDKRPKKSLGSSFYGGAPYIVNNNTITSGYLKFSQSVAPDYISRISKDGMIQIVKGDFANTVIRFTAIPQIYSAATKGDNTFPNMLSYSMRVSSFDVSLLSKTVSGTGNVDVSAEDVERMRSMGAIIPDPPAGAPPGGDHGGSDEESDDDELSETSREQKELKRRKLNDGATGAN